MFIWPFGSVMFIIPIVMFFVAFRFIRHFMSSRRNRYLDDDRFDSDRFRNLSVDIRRLGQAAGSSDRAGGDRMPEGSGSKYHGDSIEAKIFRLADKQNGVITVSDAVIETGMSLSDTEELLEGMVDGVHVKMEITERGTVQYEFPELMDQSET